MSNLRHQVIVTALFLSTAVLNSAAAKEVNTVQDLRQWAAHVIRGNSASQPEALSNLEASEPTPASIFETFKQKIHGLLVQAGQLVEQRIGWLRPTNVKELALIWLAVAFALPWAFVSWLRPILKHDLRPVRWIVVGLWTSLALWIAWITWGAPSGSDRFASTMLIGLPLLLMYFNCVASSVATPAKG